MFLSSTHLCRGWRGNCEKETGIQLLSLSSLCVLQQRTSGTELIFMSRCSDQHSHSAHTLLLNRKQIIEHGNEEGC